MITPIFKYALIVASVCVVSAVALCAAAASQGTVTKRISGCDYFMVNATHGYATDSIIDEHEETANQT